MTGETELRGAARWRCCGLRCAGGGELCHRYDVRTLHELVKELTREQVAAIPGIGPARMRRLDAAVAEHGLAWVTKVSPADGEPARVTHLRAVEAVAA